MLAVQHTQIGQRLTIRDIDVPAPAPGEVLIKVEAASICHTDLGILDYTPDDLRKRRIELPLTLGHETAGVVCELGAGVTSTAVGDRVVVFGAWGCGSCAQCARGEENLCLRRPERGWAMPGLGRAGGMAEYLLVDDARHLVQIPEDLDFAVAAPLADAGVTPYHAVDLSRHKLTAGATAVVIGAGGLGHVAIQILKAVTPATVVAVDTDPAKLELAERSGADFRLLSHPGTADEIRRLTGGDKADVVLDFVGAPATTELGLAVVRGGGDITVVGAGGGRVPVGISDIPELTARTVYWGGRSDLIAVVDLARRGLIEPAVQTYPLKDALTAFDDVHHGRVLGRAVLVP